ncbi:MAG: CehA/McbA family metallohydrolase [Anaerolineae bacterium]|nr:CehA/McbA family metallohydrolase [Anaerolineae bacterium]
MTYSVEIGRRRFHGLRGNLHMHTVHSDGTKTHQELAQIAEQAGLDYLIVTDHNVLVTDAEGWHGKTLVLVGEEVHDQKRLPQSSHTLCFDIHEDVTEYADDPQRLIDAVAAQGGFTFLAHPFEHDAVPFLPEPNISWRDWQVTGYAGIELWNYMSEFKGALTGKAHAVLCAYFPALTASGPYPETLRKWDELLQTRPVAALGGSDAHGNTYHLGPLSREVQSYGYLFRCVNTHLLSEEPLTGDAEHDRAVIYGALRTGRGFLGYERPGEIARFSFWARSGDSEATMGETLAIQGKAEFRVTCPRPAELRLIRNGQVVAHAQSERLTLVAHEEGVYRAEAYRRYAGRRRGWIFSNPIYVR